MKRIVKGSVIFFLVTLVFSCVTEPGGSSTTSSGDGNSNFIIFLNVTETEEYRDVASIAIVEGASSGMASYSVDRYTEDASMLLTLEFGSFQITGDEISIQAGDISLTGTMNENTIDIDGTVYTLSEE